MVLDFSPPADLPAQPDGAESPQPVAGDGADDPLALSWNDWSFGSFLLGGALGGVLFGIAHELGVPIRFIGVGEGIEDLRAFEPRDFVKALFEK